MPKTLRYPVEFFCKHCVEFAKQFFIWKLHYLHLYLLKYQYCMLIIHFQMLITEKE